MKVKDLKKLLSRLDDETDVKIKCGVRPDRYRDPFLSMDYIEEKEVKVDGNCYSLCCTGRYKSIMTI